MKPTRNGVNFSSPAGASINDGIPQDFSSVLYVSVDYLSSPILSAGRGAFLVKADNKEAYRCSQFTLMISPIQGVQ